MVRQEFQGFLKTLYDYFDRQPPRVTQIDVWLEAVANIPGEALPTILKELYQGDNIPRNLPKAMWAIYVEWKRGTNFIEDACECHHGYWDLCFYLPDESQWAVYSIYCGRCHKTTGPHSRFELLDKKYLLPEPTRLQAEPPEWGFIAPDGPSLAFFQERVRVHLAEIVPKFDYSPSARDLSDPECEGLPF